MNIIMNIELDQKELGHIIMCIESYLSHIENTSESKNNLLKKLKKIQQVFSNERM